MITQQAETLILLTHSHSTLFAQACTFYTIMDILFPSLCFPLHPDSPPLTLGPASHSVTLAKLQGHLDISKSFCLPQTCNVQRFPPPSNTLSSWLHCFSYNLFAALLGRYEMLIMVRRFTVDGIKHEQSHSFTQ